MFRGLKFGRRRSYHIFAMVAAEGGQALVLYVLGLAGLIGLVGMSIDIGHLVYERTSLQAAADAAALAGAQDLDGTAGSATVAQTTADQYLANNGFASAPCRPNCATVNGSYDTITVTVAQYMAYWFLPVVQINGATPSAAAASKMYKKSVTGYSWNAVAPFTIWGGSRTAEVHPGVDNHCQYHTCVGQTYTFLDTGWMGASGGPTGPDWTANGSNNFKGDINHGAGGAVVQVGDSFTSSSNGGLGNVTPPAVGSIIILPVMSLASGNSNNRTFTIAEWVLVQVNPGCKKQHCDGVILGPASAPAGSGADTTGSVPPPATTAQFLTYGALIQ